MPTMNIDEIKAKALSERGEEVSKEMTKKYKVIAKRQGQLDAHVTSFAAKVRAFEDAVTAADTPEKVLGVLAAHKFPASTICLSVKQED